MFARSPISEVYPSISVPILSTQ